ncbi:winged helix-turn-helix transcriptional regulator, partial [Enterococcus faecalis]|uniref:winged helix-turn-helix transcriptional regulator n=1 Tax=Enterococcus faecalis TaxID=1351 RepID=UPI003D6BDD73
MEKVKTESSALCPKFEKSFSILGKNWNGLIIDVLLERGPQRFDELKVKIPMLSDRVLVDRLKELEAEGIITKVVRCA